MCTQRPHSSEKTPGRVKRNIARTILTNGRDNVTLVICTSGMERIAHRHFRRFVVRGIERASERNRETEASSGSLTPLTECLS